jgi:hypothetical protein
MAALSEWLQIMLAEIARKREEVERARDEDAKRDTERVADAAPPTKLVGGAQR